MVNFAAPTATTAHIREASSAQSSAGPKAVGTCALYHLRTKPIAKSKPAAASPLEIELAKAVQAFARYQSTHIRDAVYIYLASVFAVVMRWRRLNCAMTKSKAALRLCPNAPQMKGEPFGIVIFCTSDAEIVDAKTRSKWSRVLRYAVRAKPPGQRLTDFVKFNGGLNECARKFGSFFKD